LKTLPGEGSVETRIRESLEMLESIIEGSGLERSGSSSFLDLLSIARREGFPTSSKRVLRIARQETAEIGSPSPHGLPGRLQGVDRATGLIRDYSASYARSYYARTSDCTKPSGDDRRSQETPREGLHRGHQSETEGLPPLRSRPGYLLQDRGTVYHFLIDEFRTLHPSSGRTSFPH